MIIETYNDLRRAIIDRRRELGMTQEAANDRAGLTGNYWSKLEIGMKNYGYISLPMTLAALDLDLLLYPEPEERTAA